MSKKILSKWIDEIDGIVLQDVGGVQNKRFKLEMYKNCLRINYLLNKSPDEISDLLLWLDAVQIFFNNDSALSVFADQSENSMDALQSTEAYKPLFKQGGIIGLNSVYFDGSNDYFKITNELLNFGTANFTIGIVFKYIDTGNSYPVLLSNTSSWSSGAITISIDHAWSAGKVGVTLRDYSSGAPFMSSTSLLQNTNYFVIFMRSGNSFSMYLDNTLVASNTFTGSINYDLGTGMAIGGGNWDGSNSYFKGYLPELIIYNKALSAEEISYLWQYIQEKWEIGL